MSDGQPITVPCKKCGTPVEVVAFLAKLANDHGSYCTPCMEAMRLQSERERVNVRVVRSFSKLCPPCFPDTDRMLLPCPKRTNSALQWQYGTKGLNCWGWPGTGKTRTMSMVLERELTAGRTIAALGPLSFREQCEAREFRRSHWLRWLSTVDILFIDDLDKQNLTRSMEKDLFGVLNNRMGRRPVMTSGNTRGDVLEKMFALGKPMVDRIRRYCVNIHFGQEDIGL